MVADGKEEKKCPSRAAKRKAVEDMKASMAIEDRKRVILNRLFEDGIVRVTPLSRELGVTPVTVRSDLAMLEKQGALHRTQGGAVPAGQDAALPRRLRESPHTREKQLLAARFAEMVEDGETLFLNSGTTTLCAALMLKAKNNLKVVTNSVEIAMELGDHPGFRVVLLGGAINTQFGFCYGADAQMQLARYKADKAVLAMDGIAPATMGLTTYHAEEAMLDAQMMERAQRSIILADHSKFGRESFSVVDGIDRVDCIVTGEGGDEAIAGQLRAMGIELVIA